MPPPLYPSLTIFLSLAPDLANYVYILLHSLSHTHADTLTISDSLDPPMKINLYTDHTVFLILHSLRPFRKKT